MTKDELRKSLDFVNEEREKLQHEIEIKNNNWNELKKFLCDDINERVFYGEYERADTLRYIFDKMNELDQKK